MRHILHIDMDAFYAAVEQRDYPQYRKKPVVVGGDPATRGVVATCSYEARKFGIHSAMPCAQALRRCPQAIFIRPRFDVYRKVSQQIREIMHSYTTLVEPLSLDEAYLDVTESKASLGSPTLIAKSIKKDIYEQTQLTASAGVSYNKFLAKLASDMDKPNGLTLINIEQGPELVKQLLIGDFHGIGPATVEKMHSLGIYTGADLLDWSLDELKPIFGKASRYFYFAARGEDDREVISSRERKSIGSEKTYSEDLNDVDVMLNNLRGLAADVWEEMQNKEVVARTITVKVKFENFVQVTRSITIGDEISRIEDITSHLKGLLNKAVRENQRVRLLGVSVSNLTASSELRNKEQLTLL